MAGCLPQSSLPFSPVPFPRTSGWNLPQGSPLATSTHRAPLSARGPAGPRWGLVGPALGPRKHFCVVLCGMAELRPRELGRGWAVPAPGQGLGWQLGTSGGLTRTTVTGLQSPPAHTSSCGGLSPCPAGLSSCSSRASSGLKLAAEAWPGSREWSPDPTAEDRVSPLPTTGLATTGADSRSWGPPAASPTGSPVPALSQACQAQLLDLHVPRAEPWHILGCRRLRRGCGMGRGHGAAAPWTSPGWG